MSRKDIRVSGETKALANESKREGETWDDWVRRMVSLDRATRIND